MDTQASESPASRPLRVRLLVGTIRCLPFALILSAWTAVAVVRGQLQMRLIVVAIAISLLYLLFWAFRMLLSRRARLAFKGEGRTFWEGVLPLLMLWMGWTFSLIDPYLHNIFLGVAVLATIFFCIGAYASYAAIPREGGKIRLEDLSDMDGCAEGCLEVILTSLLGG